MAGLFVIDEGECAVYDHQVHVFDLGRGDFFGEELLTGELAKVRVQATTACTLHVLLEPQFLEFLSRFPDLRQQIIHSQKKARALRRVKPPPIGDPRGQTPRKLSRALTTGLEFAGRRARVNATSAEGFVELPERYDEGGEYDILLLRAEWIIELWRNGGVLERRQGLAEIVKRGAGALVGAQTRKSTSLSLDVPLVVQGGLGRLDKVG